MERKEERMGRRARKVKVKEMKKGRDRMSTLMTIVKTVMGQASIRKRSTSLSSSS